MSGRRRIDIPVPISGGVMLSYACSATCRHCMYACSPQWPADWISEGDLEQLLSQLAMTVEASPWGPDALSLNHGVHFTGGEPFLNFDLLLKAVDIAEGLGIPSTFVETNGFWAGDDGTTREKLEALRNAGLKGIMISVNPFYAEYVPFARTERCVEISRQIFGPNVMVYQGAYHRLFKRLGIEERLPFEEYAKLTKGTRIAQQVEFFLMGRAARTLHAGYPHHPPVHYFNEPCRPSFLRPWHNHFDNYGNYMPGYCGGISLGNWHDLSGLVERGIDPEDRPVLAYLAIEDIRALFRFALDLGYQARSEGYASKCDLCLDLRAYLVDVGEFECLAPREFYRQLPERAPI
ncbi:MAG: radical SAM protein [Anaerolineae bacterium]